MSEITPICGRHEHIFWAAAFIFAIFMLISFIPASVRAEGTQADAMCKPYFGQCPCGMVPKTVDRKETCVDGGGPKGNTRDCPLYCKDTTGGHITLGHCVAFNKCHGDLCDGKPCEGQPPQMPPLPQPPKDEPKPEQKPPTQPPPSPIPPGSCGPYPYAGGDVQQTVGQSASSSGQSGSQVGYPSPLMPPICLLSQYRLAQGATGADVKTLQRFLADTGDFNVESTGYFGPITKGALAQFQLRSGIVNNAADGGMLGPLTWDYIYRTWCANPPPLPPLTGKACTVGGETYPEGTTLNNDDLFAKGHGDASQCPVPATPHWQQLNAMPVTRPATMVRAPSPISFTCRDGRWYGPYGGDYCGMYCSGPFPYPFVQLQSCVKPPDFCASQPPPTSTGDSCVVHRHCGDLVVPNGATAGNSKACGMVCGPPQLCVSGTFITTGTYATPHQYETSCPDDPYSQ